VVFVENIGPYFSPKAVISCSSFSPNKKIMSVHESFLPASLRVPLRLFVGVFLVFITWISLETVSGETAIFPHFDKFAHAAVYGLLALTASLAWPALSKVKIFAGCLAYGGAIELAQGTLTVTRSPSILDFIANGFGAAIALCFLSWTAQKFVK